MTYTYISPSAYVKTGEYIKAIFLEEDDTMKWYNGRISRVHRRDKDQDGAFVECNILYDDGELTRKARLYDKDFAASKSMDAWRFASLSFTSLIQQLEEKCQENNELHDIIESYENDDDDASYTEDDSEEDEDDYEEDYEDEDGDFDEEEDDEESSDKAYDSSDEEPNDTKARCKCKASSQSLFQNKLFGTMVIVMGLYFTVRIMTIISDYERSDLPTRFRNICKGIDLDAFVRNIMH